MCSETVKYPQRRQVDLEQFRQREPAVLRACACSAADSDQRVAGNTSGDEPLARDVSSAPPGIMIPPCPACSASWAMWLARFSTRSRISLACDDEPS